MIPRVLLTGLLFTSMATFGQSEWRNLFNGKNLSGWKQLNGTARYEVVNGELVGTTVDSPVNSFLATDETFGDFILEMEFRMDSTNSGVQIRSESKPDFENGRVHGYQVDFDPTPRSWTGGVYDEARRGWIYPLTYNPSAKQAFKLKDWNHCRIEAIGTSIRVWINGIATAHVVDDMTPKGIIALQVHGIYRKEDVGLKIRWKNIRIKTKNLKRSSSDNLFIANLIEARELNKKGQGFMLEEKPAEKMVDITYNGKRITTYTYQDSIMKPVLYPIYTRSGIPITREYPFRMKPGERADHPHHVGLFFAYENVNGHDFWNASTAIPAKDRSRYGKIVHTRTVCAQGLAKQGWLIINAQWRLPSGKTILMETTTFRFTSPNETDIVIDRTTELSATGEKVTFPDRKDGLLGLRVARELELPTEWKEKFILPDGSVTPEPVANNEGVTGNYLSSEGITGEGVFGTQAQWMRLSGIKDGMKISIAMVSDRNNIASPPHWLARGYGLLAVNPLGREAFTTGKEKLNFALQANTSITFQYQIIIREGAELSVNEINAFQKQ